MSISAAVVLFAMVWFLVLFVVLPLRITTQGEDGKVVPGTPSSAPSGFVMRRKLRQTTVVAVILWAGLSGIILSGAISVRDFDFMGRLPERPAITGQPAEITAPAPATDETDG